MKKIGIYGGTFDPIHNAHLLLAETARETLGLDRVIFVPAGVPPHKRSRRISSGDDRLAMIKRAIRGVPGFAVSRFEIDSPEVSFTVETLRYFHRKFPGDEFFLLTGSDTLSDIPFWKEPAEVCRLALPVTARRPGDPFPDFEALSPFLTKRRLAEIKKRVIPMPLLEISSSEIRSRVASGRSVRFLTPDSVIRYIRERGLYSE